MSRSIRARMRRGIPSTRARAPGIAGSLWKFPIQTTARKSAVSGAHCLDVDTEALEHRNSFRAQLIVLVMSQSIVHQPLHFLKCDQGAQRPPLRQNEA